MKKRKILAFVLTLALVITLLPASAFASTTATFVERPVYRASGESFNVTLRIQASSEFTGPDQGIFLRLTNAEWENTRTGVPVGKLIVTDSSIAEMKEIITTTSALANDRPSIFLTSGSIEIDDLQPNSLAINKTYAEFVFDLTSYAAIQKDEYFFINMNITAGKDEGDIKLNISSNSTDMSDGTYILGYVGSGGNTTATVWDEHPVNVWRGEFEASPIRIQETSANSVSGGLQSITLTLPKGVEWSAKMASVQTTSGVVSDPSIYVDGSMVKSIPHDPDTPKVTIDNDGRNLNISFRALGNRERIESLNIRPVINVLRAAKKGDIAVTLRRNSGDFGGDNGLVIACYVDENVMVYTVAEEDLPDIIAGREFEDGEDPYWVEVTVEEDIASALNDGRIIEFEFPKYVQLVDGLNVGLIQTGTSKIARPDYPVDLTVTEIEKAGASKHTNENIGYHLKGDIAIDTSVIEYTIPVYAYDEVPSGGATIIIPDSRAISRDNIDKLTFVFPVTVEAGTPDGDLTVKVSGAKAGVPDTEVVVAHIVAPVEVNVELSDIRTGIQRQDLGKITIKERFPGALALNEDSYGELEITLDTSSNNIIKSINGFDKDSVRLVSGDLELDLDRTKSDGNVMTIYVDGTSIKTPGEIEISGVSVTLDRSPAEGKYMMGVGGNALVSNDRYLNYKAGDGGNFSKYVWEDDYLNVVTPAEADVYSQASFTIGEQAYKALVNGQWITVSMDAAPFVDSANRTMVPIRYAAEALGVPSSLITYDYPSRTATIIKGSKVISIPVGKNYLVVNGSPINMDTSAVNREGRIYVPVAHLTIALGSTYVWDGGSRTVTITNQDLK